MYLFEATSLAITASGSQRDHSNFQTMVEHFVEGINRDLSGVEPGSYGTLIHYGAATSRTSYSYSLKTAVARCLSAWPIAELAIHDPLGNWQVLRALDLAANGGPLTIEVGDRPNSKSWTRKELLSAISEYEFTHRGIVNLTLHSNGSPVQLSLELSGRKDGQKKSSVWKLRGASKLLASHRNIAKILNSAVEDRLNRMSWVEEYEGKSSRPGLPSEAIAELEQLASGGHSLFDFSFLGSGSYLTEVEDCYEVNQNRRIYFSRCPSCEMPVRAEAVECWNSPKEINWNGPRVLSMFAIDRRLNEILERATKNHCSYQGWIYSSRNGLNLLN